MQSMRKLHLRNYLVLIITSLAVGTTILIAGVLYITLRQNLVKEFEERVGAESRQVGLELDSYLASIRNRLKELSLDNTVRVTLMLGVDQQLKEHLVRAYGSESGPRFFVARDSGNKIFSADGKPFTKDPVAHLLAIALSFSGIEQDPKGRFRATYSLPINRQSEKIGTAAAIFRFHDDNNLIKRLGPDGKRGRLVFQKDGNLWDLFTGQTIKADSGDSKVAPILSVAYLTMEGSAGIALPLGPAFPHLLYFSSTKTLQDAQTRIFWLISALATGVLLLAALIALLVSRKLAQPLNDLSQWALEVAQGHESFQARSSTASGIVEVEQLRSSLTTMMINLHKAEEFKRYQVLFDGVSDAVLIHTSDGTILEANEVALRMLGLQREQLGTCNAQNYIPQSQIGVLENSRRQLNELKDQSVFELEIITPEGNIIPTEVHARKIIYRDQEVILSVIRDVSDRKRAESELRQSERKYRATFHAMPDSITITELDTGIYIEANEGFTQHTGYDRQEVLGRSALDLNLFKNPEDREKLIDGIKRFGRVQELDISYVNKNGIAKNMMLTAKPIDYEGEKCILTVGRDVTAFKAAEAQKKQLQAELQHAKKMEAVGTLAGGIAHDFNNALQAISGYVEMLTSHPDTSSYQQRHLYPIQSSVSRARDLVRQLLTFSRKVEPVLRPLDINNEVSQAVRLLERTIPKMISIDFHPGENLRLINGDATQLEQVLLNLGANARDAMPSGGKLIISTKNITADEISHHTHLDIDPGDYVLLTVKDTGCGIENERVEHIFEPFFTTKDVGQGTGLGLATAFGIVESHKGKIICKSQPDQGTTFEIYLPTLEDQSKVDLPPEQPSTKSIKGRGTILLVDDEKVVTTVAAEFMEQYGFKVLTAGSGEQALALFETNGKEVDLVIMDLGMPGMGGEACLKELLKINSQLSIIVASGYADAEVEREVMASGATAFIRKPYQFKDMLAKVNQIISS